MSKGVKKFTTIILVLVLTCLLLFSGCSSSSKFIANSPPENQNQSVDKTNIINPDTVIGSNNENANSSSQQGTIKPSPVNSGEVSKPAVNNVKVKALYLTGWTVGSMAKVNHYVDLTKNTELNSYVIDIKDDDGLVGYESQVPEVKEIGAWTKKYDVDKVIKAFHDNNVHIIGRIVCFKDPVLSSKKPDLAIKDVRGGLYKTKNTDGKMITWLNPYEKGSWSYLLDIAKEAVKKGFDEIQFDYIRFANDGAKKNMDFSAYTMPKHEAIDEFLAFAKKELPGVTLSADVFGIICESPADTEGIGQSLEDIGKNIDYISPMAYPSHYAYGQIVNKVTFPKPDLDPYGVVYNTLVKAKKRISQTSDYKANVRPYLQDFTASWLQKGKYQEYGAEQVRQQIKAVYDAGYDEWILWDALNSYSESAMLKKNQ